MAALIGGTDAGFTPSDKLFTYDTQLGFWAEMAQVSRPAARSYHTLTRVGDALFLFGGSDDESSPLDDLHTLDLVSLVWTAVGAAGAPPTPRKGHTASLANDRLYVFGGMGAGGGLLGDAYELDTRSLAVGDGDSSEFPGPSESITAGSGPRGGLLCMAFMVRKRTAKGSRQVKL